MQVLSQEFDFIKPTISSTTFFIDLSSELIITAFSGIVRGEIDLFVSLKSLFIKSFSTFSIVILDSDSFNSTSSVRYFL